MVEAIHLEIIYIVKSQRDKNVVPRMCSSGLRGSQNPQLGCHHRKNIAVIPIARLYIATPQVQVNDLRIME